MRALAFIILLALLSGCKHPPMSSSSSGRSPTQPGRLIGGADRIIVTNTFPPLLEERYRGFSLTISGDEARKIIRGVSSMWPYSSTTPPTLPTNSIFEWELRFYRGTNHLAVIYLAGSTFTFEDQEYGGDKGVLEAFSRRLFKLTTPPEER